jgi:hypothetical protein
MLQLRLLAACAIGAGLLSPAQAVEPFVGRWAVRPEICMGNGDSAATAPLVATPTTVSWYDGHCRIGKMYKAGHAVYLLARCFGKGDVAVTLNAYGERMRVTWGGAKVEELRRCE